MEDGPQPVLALVSVGSSIVRAHQHAIDRSRGGPTTKIHFACDGHGRPLSLVLTGRLKQFRAIATRFDATATSYGSMIDLAGLLIQL